MQMIHAASVYVDVIPDMSRFNNLLGRGLRDMAAINIPVNVDERGAARAMGRIQTLAANTAAGLRKIGAIAFKATWLTLLATAAASAAGSVVQLVAALAPLSGLLLAIPGAAAMAISAMAVFKLSVAGVGDAMKAAASGDAVAFEKALEKLSPAARAFARDFKATVPALKAFQQAAQESFFSQLRGSLGGVSRALKEMQPRVRTLAAELGKWARELISFGTARKTIGQVNNILGYTRTALRDLRVSLRPVLDGFLDLAEVGAGFTRGVVPGIADAATNFGHFLSEISASGKALEWMNNGLAVLKQLGALAADIGGILGSVFKAAAAAGSGPLGIIGQVLDQLNAVLKSTDGQKALTELFGGLAQAGKLLAPLLRTIVKAIARLLPPLVKGLLPVIEALIPPLTLFIDELSKALVPLLPELSQLLVAVVQNGLTPLVQVFVALLPVLIPVIKFLTDVLTFLTPAIPLIIGVVAALRTWAAIQTVLNVLLSANPIGLIVIAIAGLVGALVLAYKRSETFRRVVNGVWTAVRDAATNAWTKYIKPALDGMRSLWSDVAEDIQGIWDETLQPIFSKVVEFFEGTLIPAVEKVSGAFGGIASGAEAAGQKIGLLNTDIGSTPEEGNKVTNWLKTNWQPAIGLLLAGPFGAAVGLLVQHWREVKNLFVRGGAQVVGGMKNLMDRIRTTLFGGLPTIKGGWSGFWNWLRSFADRLMMLTGNAIGWFLDAMEVSFRKGVSTIGSAWDKLRELTKRPVNFVIGTVFNKGIRRLWNNVMGWLHLPGSMRIGEIPMLARGGTLDNPAPAGPMVTNGPMAIVGEGRKQHPEYVIPTDPRYRSRAQSLWAAAGGDLQMLARGGVLGDVLGGVKKIAGKVGGIGRNALDLIANPKKVWDRLVSQMVPSAAGLATSPWGTAMSKVPSSLLGTMWGAASQIIKAFGSGYGGNGGAVVKAAAGMIGRGDDRGENNNWLTRAWGWPGAPWCAMFVSEAIKQAGASKRYPGTPSAAVATFNGRMRHVPTSQGRPGDLATYGSNDHINIVESKLGGAYRTIGGNEGPVVKRSVRGGQASVLRPMAMGGILSSRNRHVFEERNLDPNDRKNPLALLGLYDDGGYVPPGLTGVDNRTGRPEALLNPRQWDIAEEALTGGRGGPLIGTLVQQLPQDVTPEQMVGEVAFALRKVRRGGVHA